MSKHNHKKKKKNPIVEEIDLEIQENINKSTKLTIKQFNFTEKQKHLITTILDKKTKVVFISGPAGSSKTMLAAYTALRLISENNKIEVNYIRTAIESSSRSLGYTPGTVAEKLLPYLAPLFEKLEELLPPQQANHLIQEEIIRALPINFVRGASWINKFAIFDEAQNASFKEITTFLTRIGENTKMLILADPAQSDISNSGFQTMFDLFNNKESEDNGIFTFSLTELDIMRSEILKYIVSVFKKLPNQNNGNGKYQI